MTSFVLFMIIQIDAKYPGCLARFAVTDVGRLYNFQGIEEWIIFSLHISVKVLISSWISISLYNKNYH